MTESSRNPSQVETEQRYEFLAALANQHCRFVVHSFGNASGDDASVEDLSTAFARQNDGDEDKAAVHLRHVALPRLNDIGVVDYDAWSKTVHYHGHSELEMVLDSIDSGTNRAVQGGD